MKLFKNIMSRKPDEEETVGKIDLDMDVEPLRRRSDILADDTGAPNGAGRARSRTTDDMFADPSKPSYGREEPEEVAGAGWGSNSWGTDNWDDDDDWGDDDIDDLDDDTPHASTADDDWSEDREFGRKAIARSQLVSGGEAEDRILETTNTKMTDRETSRRRSAMAHLKKAAAATKADRVLKDTASRDPAADPEEQSPYRDDLAKVVRPRTTSRPTSRSHTRPRSITPPWSHGEFDESDFNEAANADEAFGGDNSGSDDFGFGAQSDEAFQDPADRFADDPTERLTGGDNRFATEGSAFGQEEEAADDFDEVVPGDRSAFVPDDLSEDDFAEESTDFSAFDEDRFAEKVAGEEDDEPFEVPDLPKSAATEAPVDTFATAEADAEDADEDGPVPSTAVSEAIALANAPDEPEEIDSDDVRRKIWDLAGDGPVVRDPLEAGGPSPAPRPVSTPVAAPIAEQPATQDEGIVDVTRVVPAVTGRAGRSVGRVKTRLLGFQDPDNASTDVFEAATPVAPAAEAKYPVGWIIVVEGPGHGSCFTLFNGVSQIGRGEDQAVRLDFGDTSISRNNHAAVAFDDEQSKFFLGHGGKSNLVRLNGMPVLSTEELAHGDSIRIGETTLKFVALCGEDFNWNTTDGDDAANAEDA